MRRFFRSPDLATLIAVAVIAMPLANRLAAQDAQPANVDPVGVVAHDSVASTVAPPVAPPIDLRALYTPAPSSIVTAHASQAPLGASMTGLRSAPHLRENAGPLVISAAAKKANLGQAQALMIVGAAALITGAIIGDDPGTIIMVGGAVIGLYGLYQYLQ